jgi:hypothetical protein
MTNGDHGARDVRHVLLISVDGLHAVDLAKWNVAHPGSTLGKLAREGVEYKDAHTTTPSDSFPGMVALVTGGSPKSTGVYYDDSYDRTTYPPGSNRTRSSGTECTYFEILATEFTQILSPLNPANLPMHKDEQGNCKPVVPHEFLKVNTLFEVIHEAGGYTTWSDKHQAYDLLNGPSGKGIDDRLAPGPVEGERQRRDRSAHEFGKCGGHVRERLASGHDLRQQRELRPRAGRDLRRSDLGRSGGGGPGTQRLHSAELGRHLLGQRRQGRRARRRLAR